MNLLFDARVIQDHFPGIGRYAVNLLTALPAHLFEHDRITVLHDPSVTNTRYPHLTQTITDPRITWLDHRVPVFSLKNLLTQPPPPSSPAITHFTYYVRPVRASRPSITTIYDAISFVYPGYVPSARARLVIRLMHKLAVSRSDAFLTISNSAATDLQKYFPRMRGRTHVTPLAADAMFTPQSKVAQARLRERLGLPEQFALVVSSNKPHKNIEGLIRAWALLAANEPPLTLLIAGPSDPRYSQAQMLVSQFRIDNRVRFIGEVANDDLPALYSACTLFVYPSLYEGFGLTPLEAMACGAPVACSNQSSLPEVTGAAAALFDPRDPAAIVAACSAVLSDPARLDAMRTQSILQAATFSWDRCAKETMAVYRGSEQLHR